MSKIEISTIEQLAAKIERGAPLTEIERTTAAQLLHYAAKRLAAGAAGGRAKRKFASDKERIDFHNAKRRKKKEAS